MQNWKDPETATIHLANGEQASANVNGISPIDGSGYICVHGREIKVMPLHLPWSFDWAEVIIIKSNDSSTFEIALDPIQLSTGYHMYMLFSKTLMRTLCGAWIKLCVGCASAAVHDRVCAALYAGVKARFLPCFSSLISALSKSIIPLASFDQN